MRPLLQYLQNWRLQEFGIIRGIYLHLVADAPPTIRASRPRLCDTSSPDFFDQSFVFVRQVVSRQFFGTVNKSVKHVPSKQREGWIVLQQNRVRLGAVDRASFPILFLEITRGYLYCICEFQLYARQLNVARAKSFNLQHAFGLDPCLFLFGRDVTTAALTLKEKAACDGRSPAPVRQFSIKLSPNTRGTSLISRLFGLPRSPFPHRETICDDLVDVIIVESHPARKMKSW